MSSRQQYHNSIYSTLVAEALAGATVLQVASDVFPSVTAPDFYLLTLESIGGAKLEVVKVVDVSGTSITVERGHEGPAQDFAIGDIVQTRSTAGTFDRFGQQSDLGSTFPFVPTIVNVPLTLYIDPAGSDTAGDGSQSSPWASLYKVVSELSMLRFADGGDCTIECAAGTYSMDAQLLFDHPQGNRITIRGASGFIPMTGMPIGDYSVDRNNPTFSPPTGTEFANTAGTLAQNALEAARATQRDLDRANNRVTLAINAPTIFQWAASGADEAKVIFRSSLGLLDNVGFEFATPGGTFDNRDGICITAGSTVTVSDITIVGATRGVCIEGNSTLRGNTLAIAGSTTGLVVVEAGSAVFENIYIQGCIDTGLDGTGMATIVVEECISSGCGKGAGRFQKGASLSGSSKTWTFSGNGQRGLLVGTGATIANQSSTIVLSGNNSGGMFIVNGSDVTCQKLDSIGNEEGVGIESNGALFLTLGATSLLHNNQFNGYRGESGSVFVVEDTLHVTDNDGTGVLVTWNASIVIERFITIKGSGGLAFDAQYAGPCDITALTCDLTNVGPIHLRATGGTHVQVTPPGVGGVDPGIVFSPPINTTSPPDSAVFIGFS